MAALVLSVECTFVSCMINQIGKKTQTMATQQLRERKAGRTEHQTNLKSNRRCKKLNCIRSKHTGDNKYSFKNRNSLFLMRNDCSVLHYPAAAGERGVQNPATVIEIMCLFSSAIESQPLRGRNQCCCCFYCHLFLSMHLSSVLRRNEELLIHGRCMQRRISE